MAEEKFLVFVWGASLSRRVTKTSAKTILWEYRMRRVKDTLGKIYQKLPTCQLSGI